MENSEPLLVSQRAPLTTKDIELYTRSNIVRYNSLPDPWKDYVRQTVRIYIERYDLACVTHINIPYGLTTTLMGFLSSQEVIIEFEPILQEVMREIIAKKEITRHYIMFNTLCPAAHETPNWTIAFVF